MAEGIGIDVQQFVLARQQVAEVPVPHSIPNQAQGGKTGGRGHAPHLAIAALPDDQFQPAGGNAGPEPDRRVAGPDPRRRDETGLRRCGESVPEPDPLAPPGQGRLIRDAFHLDPIAFGLFVPGMGDAVLQSAVVRQQQQALAILVETPGRIHAWQVDKIGQDGACSGVAELAEHAKRLVEDDESRHSG